MIHYHGSPIGPTRAALEVYTGRHAFVSYKAQMQLGMVAEISQSFALDNGAFTFWKTGTPKIEWEDYYDWLREWSTHPSCDFAVVPDVIDGTEEENDELASEWPLDKSVAAVVWHTNESPERLLRLAKEWPRVAIGSSGEYDVRKVKMLLDRMYEVLPDILNEHGYPICKLHGLRMLNPKVFTKLPLSSADSTSIGRNIGIDKIWKGSFQPVHKHVRAAILTDRIEAYNSIGKISQLEEV